jgi:hypothetical protein
MAFPHVHCKSGSIAVADILTTVAAANTIVAADPSKRFCIVDVEVRAIGGAADGSTTLRVVAGTEIAWQMTTTDADEGVINRADSANVTATHLGHWAPGDTAIAMIRTGTVTTTATYIDYVVWYLVEGCN